MPQKKKLKKNNPYVIVGSFGTVHGVKGWIKVNSFTDPTDNIIRFKNWYLQDQNQYHPLIISDVKLQHTTILAKIKDCDDRDEARFYTNKLIAILREDLPDLPSDEFYCEDLMGLSVENKEGINLGIIIEILNTGANDVFVTLDDKGKRHLIPYTKDAVLSIDLHKGLMRVEWDSDF